MTNCAELDGVTKCYRCYAALCGTGATPKLVKHLLDGHPIIVSKAPTDELATPAAREMCETMMQTMRTLAGRRTHATQYATSGGRMQLPLPRPPVWRLSPKPARKKFCTSALKHFVEAPTGGPTNFDTYEKHVETSQKLFQEAENVVLNNVGIVLGIRIDSDTHILDSVGNENLLGNVGSAEQPLHCDLAPDGTAQNILALSRANEATWMQRFRGGAVAARESFSLPCASRTYGTNVLTNAPSSVCSATLRSSQLARRPPAVHKRNWSLVCPCIRGWSKWDTRRR
jgi:hypothetical protein